MKRTVSLLLAAVMLVGALCMTLPASAVSLPDTASPYTYMTGDIDASTRTMKVQLYIGNVSELFAYRVMINYNKEALEVVDTANGDVFAKDEYIKSNPQACPYSYIAAAAGSSINNISIGDRHFVAEITFKIIDATKEFGLSVSRKSSGDIFYVDSALNPVIVKDMEFITDPDMPQVCPIVYYSVSVNGTEIGSYASGDTVNISVAAFKNDSSGNGCRFNKWVSDDNVVFANGAQASTTFTMIDKDVDITAEYRIVGDADSNGRVTVGDVNTVKKMLVNMVPINNSGDIDGDGKVTVSDVNYLKKMLVGSYLPRK